MGMDRVDEGAVTVSPEEAYREHRVALLRLAYLVGASRELAEDVVQAAFATAQPRWDQVEDALPYLKGSDLRAYTVGTCAASRSGSSPHPTPQDSYSPWNPPEGKGSAFSRR